MRRSSILRLGAVVGALLLFAGCGPEQAPTTSTTDGTGTPGATPTGRSYGKSDVDAAGLKAGDASLIGFHSFTFPPEDPAAPAETDPCAAKWRHRFGDVATSASVSGGEIDFAVNDDVGPFVFQQQTTQPGTGAADLVSALRASYLGPCATWTSRAKYVFTMTEQTDVGPFGEHSFAYHASASDGRSTIEVIGVYLSTGNLLSQVEYAGSPGITASRAKAVLAAAAKLLPAT